MDFVALVIQGWIIPFIVLILGRIFHSLPTKPISEQTNSKNQSLPWLYRGNPMRKNRSAALSTMVLCPGLHGLKPSSSDCAVSWSLQTAPWAQHHFISFYLVMPAVSTAGYFLFNNTCPEILKIDAYLLGMVSWQLILALLTKSIAICTSGPIETSW